MNTSQHILRVFKDVSILGAGGKMGKGISLVVLQEMARTDAEHHANVNSGNFRLTFIDTRQEALDELRIYLRNQLVKYAEKNIISLRHYFYKRQDLLENGEMIDVFVQNALALCRFSTNLQDTKNSLLIFEAIFENIQLKEKVYNEILQHNPNNPLFFTNTSSIPIHIIDKHTNYTHQIIGFHFYNPPAIQKLVELIFAKNTSEKNQELAIELGNRFHKTLVTSNDVAGFIGNGHFIREGLFALRLLNEMQEKHGFQQSVYLINEITEKYLLRPMGIFQLIDYVGLDVFSMILNTMNTFIENEHLENEFVLELLENGVKGGQLDTGFQRNGFFEYEKNKIIGVLTNSQNTYETLESDWKTDFDNELETDWELPLWKELKRNHQKKELIANHFEELTEANDAYSLLAKRYLQVSSNIVANLVKNKVANSTEDVHKVLMNGFFHLYGIGNIKI